MIPHRFRATRTRTAGAGFAVLAITLAVVCSSDRLRGQDPGPAPADDHAGRLDEMKQTVRSFEAAAIVDGARRPAVLRPEPLHRWNDPTRAFSDGTLWAWGSPGRPAAVATMELYPHEQQKRPTWSLEFVSLSTERVEVEGGEGFDTPWGDLAPPAPDGQVHWSPKSAGVEFHPVPGAPAPAGSEAARLRQMRDLAQRFSARQFYPPKAQTYELRLLPRPIDRYADAAAGLVDGAMFVFVYGTNPEVLLLIEARQGRSPAEASWRYAIARLSRAGPTVSFDQQEVWTEPFAQRPSPTDPYFIARKVRREPR